MSLERSRSIRARIDELARRHASPDDFTSAVRELFVGKGISLDESAEPYEGAIAEAFARDATVRESMELAQRRAAELDARLAKLDARWRDQITELFRLKEGLEERLGTIREASDRLQRAAKRLPSGRKPQGFVPGPEGLQ